MSEIHHLRGPAIAHMAQHDLAGFVAATSRDANYRIGRWHQLVCSHIEAALDDAIAGREPRVIMQGPPRHGKTDIFGRGAGPAIMARRPGARVIYATHNQTLADKTSMAARRVVSEHLAPFYAGLRPSQEKWTASWWETANGGGMRAVGTGVGTAGEGAHLAIVDDPFGSMEDSHSLAHREKVKRWFLGDIESRMMQGGGIVVMHTRWHEDDLVGFLLREQPGMWRVLSWPAIAEVDEPGFRKAGEALVPHLFPLDRLERIRSRMVTEHGSRVWSALYQQRPVPDGGGMFQRSWFRERYAGDPRNIAESADEVWVTSDAAAKGGAGSDLCAIQVWARKGPKGFLLDRVAARMDYPEYERRMDAMVAKWDPWLNGTVVEDVAHGAVYRQRRMGTVRGLVGFVPTRDTPGRGSSKEDRARYMVGPAEAGQVLLPESAQAPWVEEWLDCICAFPAGAHDDEVDAASQVWVRWRGKLRPESSWEDYDARVAV